jgi:hypothetical protein
VNVAVDWDDTLVDVRTGEWITGAADALHELRRRQFNVIIWSCRANWQEGLDSIVEKLYEIGLVPDGKTLSIVGKPMALAYIDDKALRFQGDWQDVLVDVYREQSRAQLKGKARVRL